MIQRHWYGRTSISLSSLSNMYSNSRSSHNESIEIEFPNNISLCLRESLMDTTLYITIITSHFYCIEYFW